MEEIKPSYELEFRMGIHNSIKYIINMGLWTNLYISSMNMGIDVQ
jgi:hypothetical protein